MCHADDLQAVSVDEALIDVTTTVNQLRIQARRDSSSYDPAKNLAEKIRAEVRKATTCEGHFFLTFMGNITDFLSV
jgi:DNA repair protein REV1